jgi:hypothetical protein
MNKKLALLLALVFVGTAALPAKKEAAPKKEKKAKEYTILVANDEQETANVTLTDNKNKEHKLTVPGGKTETIKSSEKISIKKATANIGGKTITKNFKLSTKNLKITKNQKGELKIKKGTQKTKKLKKCTCPKGTPCTCKDCKCKNGKKAKKA